MTKIVCRELESSYDINLISNQVSHCCKFKPIDVNVTELANLEYKFFDNNKETLKARSDLNNGIKTTRCNDCWNKENNNQLSWRVQNNTISTPNLVKINIQLSSLCNQACFYCSPVLSSTIKSFGSWDESGKRVFFQNTDFNLDPIFNFNHLSDFIGNLDISKKVLDLSVTGGEPFIIDNFNENFENLVKAFCDKDTSRKVIFGVTTNTNVKLDNLKKFYETINKLKSKYKLTVYIESSVENLEERAEYVRHGLKWDNFLENFKIHHRHADNLAIKMTINALSIVNISDFFKYFLSFKNVVYVYNYTIQQHWRMNILDNRFQHELNKLSDVITSDHTRLFRNMWYKDLKLNLTNDVANANIFKNAITNIDSIRSTKCLDVFPEYQQWFDDIKPLTF